MQDKRRANEDLPLEILPALMAIHDVSVRMLGSALNIPDLPSPANDAFGEKRRRAAAVQDAGATTGDFRPREASCASPLALSGGSAKPLEWKMIF
jgi:hypothetical protein